MLEHRDAPDHSNLLSEAALATGKLAPYLFSANARTAESEGSTPYLHFIASVREERNLYTFACETRPLDSVNSFGIPKRCPLCGQQYPIGSKNCNERRNEKC